MIKFLDLIDFENVFKHTYRGSTIDEIREYLLSKLYKRETLSGEETGPFINDISKYLPGCVKKVLLMADEEFFSRQSVDADMHKGFDFIIANKRAKPPFDPSGLYQPWKRKLINTTALCISHWAGRKHADLSPCASQRKRWPLRFSFN